MWQANYAGSPVVDKGSLLSHSFMKESSEHKSLYSVLGCLDSSGNLQESRRRPGNFLPGRFSSLFCLWVGHFTGLLESRRMPHRGVKELKESQWFVHSPRTRAKIPVTDTGRTEWDNVEESKPIKGY